MKGRAPPTCREEVERPRRRILATVRVRVDSALRERGSHRLAIGISAQPEGVGCTLWRAEGDGRVNRPRPGREYLASSTDHEKSDQHEESRAHGRELKHA